MNKNEQVISMDFETGGFNNGHLPLLIAPTGIGKSQLLEHLINLDKEFQIIQLEKGLPDEEQISPLNYKIDPGTIDLEPFLYEARKEADEIKFYLPTSGRKDRRKNTSNSLAKRRVKNKIAKKSKQKNRKK